MSLWTKIKSLLSKKPVEQSAPVVVEFPHPRLLPELPGAITHTTTTLTESVSCSVGASPNHEMRVVIVDGVVKTIWSPCNRVVALTAAQLGGESCGRKYIELRDRLSGKPVIWPSSWTQAWVEHQRQALDATLDQAIRAADRRRAERRAARLEPITCRQSSEVWEAYLHRLTGLAVTVDNTRVSVETPDATTMYCYSGSVDNGVWALAQGPSDQRVYDMLNKYIRLTSKLASHT